MSDELKILILLMAAQEGGVWGWKGVESLVKFEYIREEYKETTLKQVYEVLKWAQECGHTNREHIPSESRGPGRYIHKLTAKGRTFLDCELNRKRGFLVLVDRLTPPESQQKQKG